MALIVADRVKETTTTTGTGTLSLAGAVAGFQSFVAGVGTTNTTYYAITDSATGDWEVGIGTVTSGSPDTLSRDTVLESSNSDNLVNFSAGQKLVICTQPAEKAVYLDASDQLVIDGTSVTATAAELNYVDGVTSNIQTQLDAKVAKSGDTMTGFLTLHADPTNAFHAATKEYVDTIASASLHYHDPVRVESPVALTATYNNGTSGVGATLTNSGTQAALVIDGVTVDVADRVLVYEQVDATQNGVYTVTDTGSASTNWVLTRATDADSAAPSDPDALGQGDAFFVREGNTGAGELYVMNTEGTITFGTTNITFSQISSAAIYSAGAGLDLTGTVFSHSDTSSQASVNNSNGTVIQDITLDTFGHVTALGSADLDGRYYTETEIDSTVSGLNSAISLKQDAATALTTSTTFGGDVSGTYNAIVVANDSHTHDTRYYTETETGSFFAGTTAITGYNKTNWDTAHGWGNHASAGYLTGNQTITLSGDVSGSGTTAITVTIADDSHNHIISNVDGLQTALDAKLALAGGTLTGNLNLGDNVKAIFGAGSDLQIYHNGSSSRIEDSGTGNLEIRGDNLLLRSYTGGESFFRGFTNGQVDLFYDGSAKLATTATGINVTGDVTATTFTGALSGNATTATTLQTARTIALGGDVTGSASFNGSANITITAAVVDDLHAHSFNNLLNKASGTGTYTTSGDFRAPIFYDNDNTAYYGDFAGITRINTLRAGDTIDDTPNGEAFTHVLGANGSSNRVVYFDGAGTSPSVWWGNGNAPYGAIDADTGGLRMWYNNTSGVWSEQFRVTNGYTYSINSSRSPIFYDYNNTAYYGDFASTSNISRLQLGNWSGSSGAGLSVQSVSTSSGPIVAKTTNYNTVWSILPWDGGTTYISSGVYYNGSVWVHASDNATNCLFMLNPGGNTTWYASNNSSGSWNVAEAAPLWSNVARWVNNVTAPNDVSAPIFYDSANTAFFVDPASTADTALTIRGGALFGPNTSWSRYLLVGGDGRQNYTDNASVASVCTTSGNLHIDAASGFETYINFYDGVGVKFGNGASTTVAEIASDGTFRSPIFYDYNNTGYYTDPASTSNLYNLQLTGAKNTYLYINPGNNYEAMVRYNGGSGNTWYVGKRITSQLVGTESFHFYSEAATQTVAGIDTAGNTFSIGSSRAPIFYDSNDTAYYTDPASTSNLNAVQAVRFQNAVGVTVDRTFGINFDNNDIVGNESYAIFREAGAWAPPYPDLRIAFHTGIKFGANAAYNGMRFYTDYDMSAQVMSVNNGSDPLGASNVYVNNSLQAGSSLRAPIFYDSDNTAYYTNPASTSVMNAITALSVAVTAGEGREVQTYMPGSYTTGDLVSGHEYGWYSDHWRLGMTRSGGVAGEDFVIQFNGSRRLSLTTGGNLTATGTVTASSDIRLKDNIETIDDALSKVNALRGVYFTRNDLKDATKRHIGFIAQEIEKIIPEVVSIDPTENQYKSVAYGNITALLIEAIKEQQTQIDDLKSQITKLKGY
jgi:hypothetical protein